MIQGLVFHPKSMVSMICRCGYVFNGWQQHDDPGFLKMPEHQCPLKSPKPKAGA